MRSKNNEASPYYPGGPLPFLRDTRPMIYLKPNYLKPKESEFMSYVNTPDEVKKTTELTEEQLKGIPEEKLCKICLVRLINCAYIPCGHR